jgi:F-type H+-transporting ATPase subunit a
MNFIEILEHHLLDHPIGLTLTLGSLNIPVTKHEVMMVVAVIILIISLPLAARSWPLVPTGGRNLLEAFVVFIRDEVVLANTGEEGRPYVPYFLSVFFFILVAGLLGMVPGAATATGNISVTATLALFTFGLINYAGVRKYGVVHHVKNFIPHGLPIWLVPLMLPLELAGLVTRSFALCIRLFANMIAGHIVIMAFLSLIFIFSSYWVSIPAEAAAVGLGLLEVFVVFLQAYIFTLLSSIFVGASLHPH